MKFQVGDKLTAKNWDGAGWLHGTVITETHPDAEFREYTATKADDSRTFSRNFVEERYDAVLVIR